MLMIITQYEITIPDENVDEDNMNISEIHEESGTHDGSSDYHDEKWQKTQHEDQ